MIRSLTLVSCLLLVPTSAFVTMTARSPNHMGQQGRGDFIATTCGGTAAALVGALSVPISSKAATGVPVVGSQAPNFTLPSNTGKDISLSDLTKNAKHTVLYFYPGDFTSGCTIEAQSFQKDFPKYGELGAQIVGVSVDTVDKHLNFKKSYGLDFPLLSDVGAVVSDSYGSKLEIPFMGKFANRQTYIIGSNGKIEKVFTDVESRVAKHSADVLAALATL